MSEDALYILEGVTRNGSKLYYTGRAGDKFVHAETAKSFAYWNLTSATKRCVNLNEMTALHGVHFTVRLAFDCIMDKMRVDRNGPNEIKLDIISKSARLSV